MDSSPTKSLNKGDLVHEAGGWHRTPARIIEVIYSHGSKYYRIHFKDNHRLRKIILPDYRLEYYGEQ